MSWLLHTFDIGIIQIIRSLISWLSKRWNYALRRISNPKKSNNLCFMIFFKYCSCTLNIVNLETSLLKLSLFTEKLVNILQFSNFYIKILNKMFACTNTTNAQLMWYYRINCFVYESFQSNNSLKPTSWCLSLINNVPNTFFLPPSSLIVIWEWCLFLE